MDKVRGDKIGMFERTISVLGKARCVLCDEEVG